MTSGLTDTQTLDWPRDGRHAFLGGKWVNLGHVDHIPAISPIDETIVGQIPAARAEHVQLAVDAIKPCLRDWAALGAKKRARYLRDFGSLITEHAHDLVELDTIDAGLTTMTGRKDVANAVDDVELFAAYATSVTGQTFFPPQGVAAYTVREPYGIAAMLTPFNHPVAFAINHTAPALLAGNAVIVKPPEQASLSTLALAEVARHVFPPGVFNVLTGFGVEVGQAICEHPDIPRIDLVGGLATGRKVLRTASERIKRVSLELGAKNALIVTADVDPDYAATLAVRGMNFTHGGQSCQSNSRLLVQSSIYEPVVELVAEKMRRLRIGDPRAEGTDVGPLCYKEHYERVLAYINDGVQEGARLVVGGRPADGFAKGYYVEPTLFADVTGTMSIANEEIFGPVLSAIRYENLTEAIEIANATEYGLNVRVLAKNADTATAIGRDVDAGVALCNMTSRPRGFGLPNGGFKQSGLGKQGCLEEVLSYTQEKLVVVGPTATAT